MFLFVSGVVLLLVAVGGVVVALIRPTRRLAALGTAVVAGLLGVGAITSQTFYSQDSGEASVLVDVSGTIAGQETTPGFHGKAPWQTVKTFNIRNQTVSFVGDGGTDYSGGSAAGPQVTAQDSDGVSSDIDVNIVYSIAPEKVTEIYRQYRDESNFVQQFVVQQIRSVTRAVPNQFSTLDLITKRTEVSAALRTALESAWRGTGVQVDQVNLQEIRPPKAVSESYSAAQQALVQVQAEKAKLEATKVSAQQQVVQAQAQAEANAELAKGLTPSVLQSRYIDALKSIGAQGNVIVVPQGSTPFVQVQQK
ncbi:SPFH domain-containing protein [Amnibacterium endophyticum]|uniref:SPFH domain-containing protein n=1 Tax=Amnibacterium endophyticum TaxID=2109337 RepID=A0ABW4LC41_9MICO